MDKSVEEFYKRKAARDGCDSYCKECRKIISTGWNDAHKDAALTTWRKSNQKHKAKRDAYREQYRHVNRARINQRQRFSYAHNPDVHIKRAAEWARENPDKVRANKNRRRARKLAAGGSHDATDIQRQGNIQGWHCWWCGHDCKKQYDVDHLIPLARGGHNGPTNLVIACDHCNSSKGDKLPEEWAGRLF